jgi:hypothetical protein
MGSRREFTKAQRKRLRELGGVAYERDLGTELGHIEAAFRRWRAEEIDAFELSDLIHRFHQGPSRQLFSRYDSDNIDFAVASAIHRRVLTEAEAGAEMIELLASHLAFLREQEER